MRCWRCWQAFSCTFNLSLLFPIFKCVDYAKNDHVHRQWPIPPPDSATLPKLTGVGKYVWESFLAFQTWPHTGYTRSFLWTSTISSSTGWWSTYRAPLWPMVRWGLLKKHIIDVLRLSISWLVSRWSIQCTQYKWQRSSSWATYKLEKLWWFLLCLRQAANNRSHPLINHYCKSATLTTMVSSGFPAWHAQQHNPTMEGSCL